MLIDTPAKRPLVFVHGLWLHAESWHRWIELFRSSGYDAVAAQWPGDAATTAATRRAAGAVARYGVAEIADHVAEQLKSFDRLPILIGHSFGGLIVQNLLGRGLAAAAVAIDPAPMRGVAELPLRALKAVFPVLRNPFNYTRAVSLSEAQFRFGFANAVPLAEARELFDTYAMPAPARPLFQAATAMFNPNAATKVRVENNDRGPLLLIAGSLDNTVPPVLVRSAFRKYGGSTAITELKELDGLGHSLVIDSGWRDVAECCLGWLRSKQL